MFVNKNVKSKRPLSPLQKPPFSTLSSTSSKPRHLTFSPFYFLICRISITFALRKYVRSRTTHFS